MILMQPNSESIKSVSYLVGSIDVINEMTNIPALVPFDERVVDLLNDVSRELLGNKKAKSFSDVVTFGFWIRKASLLNLKERFLKDDKEFRLGKGVVFHIAPSNVPVNFAYSLVSGLITGNANIVRVPSKDFEQVRIIVDAFNKALDTHEEIRHYIACVRYDRDRVVNDYFSSMADMRVVWGGDQTIAELRQSPLPPRSGEITFADRYSIAVIDADYYLGIEDKKRIANDFYNDTFFSDQNACTSPRVVVWTGGKIDEAKKTFWEEEHSLVKEKYGFQPIQGVNKLTSAFKASTEFGGISVEPHEDNLVVRVSVPEVSARLMDYRDNSGYFYEYDCKDIMEIKLLCNDKRCQTVAYIGNKEMLTPLLQSGIKGIDRVVPVGKTMDFDLIWDGYNLASQLTRVVTVR